MPRPLMSTMAALQMERFMRLAVDQPDVTIKDMLNELRVALMGLVGILAGRIGSFTSQNLLAFLANHATRPFTVRVLACSTPVEVVSGAIAWLQLRNGLERWPARSTRSGVRIHRPNRYIVARQGKAALPWPCLALPCLHS